MTDISKLERDERTGELFFPCGTCGNPKAVRTWEKEAITIPDERVKRLRCVDCFEVEGRLERYLRSKNGRRFVKTALANRRKGKK